MTSSSICGLLYTGPLGQGNAKETSEVRRRVNINIQGNAKEACEGKKYSKCAAHHARHNTRQPDGGVCAEGPRVYGFGPGLRSRGDVFRMPASGSCALESRIQCLNSHGTFGGGEA